MMSEVREQREVSAMQSLLASFYLAQEMVLPSSVTFFWKYPHRHALRWVSMVSLKPIKLMNANQPSILGFVPQACRIEVVDYGRVARSPVPPVPYSFLGSAWPMWESKWDCCGHLLGLIQLWRGLESGPPAVLLSLSIAELTLCPV